MSINKYTTQEVLNKVYTDESDNTISLQAQTAKETLNAVLSSGENSLNVSLAGSNTITGDVTISGDLTVQGSNTNTYDEIVQGQFVVQTQVLSSAPTPDGDADDFIIENNASGGMTIMTPDASPGRIAFASPSDNYGAVIMHQQSTGKLSINTEGATGNISMATGNGVTAVTIDSNQNATFVGPTLTLKGTIARSTNDDGVCLDLYNEYEIDDARTSIRFWSDDPAENYGAKLMFHHNNDWANAAGTFSLNMRKLSDGSLTEVYNIDGHTLKHNFKGSVNVIGSVINLTDNTTNDTNKNAVITHSQYGSDAETEGFLLMQGFSNDSTNRIDIGGGNSQHNATEEIKFHTAANATTATGTARMVIDDNSRISLSNNGGEATNTIFGYQAGNSIHASSGMNTFIGHQVADAVMNGDADENTAVGHLALSGLTEGTMNTVMGSYAGINITTGDNNVLIGRSAGNNHNSSNVVAIGTSALASIDNATADGSVAIGYNSLTALTSGASNTSVGLGSMDALTIGSNNTGLGDRSLSGTDDGANNVAVGAFSLESGNCGDGNTAVGASSLQQCTASGTVAVGYKALRVLTSGAGNVAIGQETMGVHTTGGKNVAIGHQVMYDTDAGDSSKSSSENVFIGYQVASGGWSDAACNHNVGIGNDVMRGALNGANYNVALGSEALMSLTSVEGSVAIGYKSLTALTSGTGNTAVGYKSLESNQTGGYNTAVGNIALDACTGASNTGIGFGALGSVVGGGTNVGLGSGAGNSGTNDLTTGNENTLIGNVTQVSAVDAENQTVIGYGAVGQANDSVTLGNADVTAVYMAQDKGATMYAGGLSVDNGTGTVNRGNSTGDIFEARGLNASQMKITTSAFTVTPSATFSSSVSVGGDTNHNANYIVDEQGRQNHVANTMSSPYYRFDGVNDYIQILADGSSTFNTQHFTIEAMVYIDTMTTNGDSVIIWSYDFTSHSNPHYAQQFRIDQNGEIQFWWNDGSTSQNLGDAKVAGKYDPYFDKWTHLVVSYTSGSQKLYINGNLIASDTDTGTISYYAQEVWINKFNYANGKSAQFGRVRFFNNVLDATEVKELYSGASVPYKYKGANQTAINNNLEHSDWVENGTSHTDNQADPDGGTDAVKIDPSYSGVDDNYFALLDMPVTKGKAYRFSVQLKANSGTPTIDLNLRDDGTSNKSSTSCVLSTSWQTFSVERVAGTSAFDIFIGGYSTFTNSDGIIYAYKAEIVPIGAVAEYDSSGIASDKWLDKSGNDLHGTTSGNPSVENAPSGDDGLVYEEGTWTPIFKSGNNVLTIPGTATYKRVGNMVSVFFGAVDVSTSGTTSGTQFQIQEFPYTAPATKQWVGSLVEYGGGITFEGEGTPYIVIGSGTTANLYQRNDAQTLQHADITGTGANSYFSFQITYEID